jgi:hypothetical protein
MSAVSRLVMIVALWASGALADALGLPTTIKGASLFKNGLALVTREATAPGAGEFVLSELPAPVHGSFWVVPPAGVKLTDGTSFAQPRRTPVEATNLVELLRANLGRRVEIKVDGAWLAGTLRSLPERVPTMLVQPTRRGYYEYEYSAYRPPTAEPGDSGAGFVLLDTEQGQTALNPAEIRGVRATAISTRFERLQPGVGLRVRLTGGGLLRVAYLAWGMTWAPSYRVEPRDEDATVEMKAAVLNDLEDLRGVGLSFITGFPNIRFAHTQDPVAMTQDVTSFLQTLSAPEPSTRRGGGVMTQQAVMFNTAVAAPPPVGNVYQPQAGEQAEDLFFYPQPDVTLAKGERGYYPLFAAQVPCRSLYVWDVPDAVDERDRWRPWWDRPDRDEGRVEAPEVWHVLRLKNTSAVPWTTAPAIVYRDNRVLGQDILYYNGLGRETDLRVTRCIDIPSLGSETVTNTEHNAFRLSGTTYTRFTVKGTLTVYNRKVKPITVLVRKRLSGQLKEAAPVPEKRALAAGLSPVNPRQELSWKVEIPSGERAELTYSYQVLAAQ